ncbi:DUF2489 domain-containing protein [Reinekea thalattae]|uniref:DUF2489 domain-containing protein n=1 Tax=Reinekea thalattae TaxID=2593301 RepID=A0A5C8ZA75_9GAMM|nr:DUF2489 domain-containing protein [Reinekea thalattae]TXR53720.1 DUF2489 domain-containing protein [Reinekea thalattae]
MIIAFVVLALIIIALLATYAFYLLKQVRQQEQQKQKIKQQQEKIKTEKQQYILESLRVISHTALNEELSVSEAVIRCKMLLEGLQLSEQQWQPYTLLRDVFDQVAEFDTHQARKDLSKQQRREQDRQRTSIEEKYKAPLTACFEQLKTIDESYL